MNTPHPPAHHGAPRPLSDAELQTLEGLLQALDHDHSMSVEELDGYCAALACCPEPVPPEVWWPRVLGEEGVKRADAPAFAELRPLVERHRLAVLAMLEQGEGFAPVLAEDDSGALRCHDWAVGFVCGMSLAPDAWDALDDDESLHDALDPVMRLWREATQAAGGDDLDDELDLPPIADDERESLIHDLFDGVQDVYQYFAPARARASAPVTVRHAAPRVGRNEPCPCGSGRKFKQCCAA